MTTGRNDVYGRQEEIEIEVQKRTAKLTELNAKLRREIDELKKANRTLLDSRIGYRNLLEGMQVGTYSTTPDGRFIEVNTALAHILGYANQKALLKINATSLYVDPMDQARLQTAVDRDGIVLNFDVRVYRKGGAVIWMRNGIMTVCDTQGMIAGYEGIVLDVTEFKRAEQSLRESENWMFGIPNALPIPQFVIDRDHRIIHWNRALQERTGIGPEEVLGTVQQ